MRDIKDWQLGLGSGGFSGGEPDTQAVREAGRQLLGCISALEDILEEPLKTKFLDVKKELGAMLGGLPKTIDEVNADFNAVMAQARKIVPELFDASGKLKPVAKGKSISQGGRQIPQKPQPRRITCPC